MTHSIDIVDRYNQPTGEQSDPDDATNRGLWHRGVHVFIFTSDKRVLIQKRSQSTVQYPGMLDIGVGGFVDSGETPEQAAVRETYEETGLIITSDQLHFLGTTRMTKRWRRKGKQKTSKAILYSYTVQLTKPENKTHPQKSEVEWIEFISLRRINWLVINRSIKNLGTLLPFCAYYSKILRSINRH